MIFNSHSFFPSPPCWESSFVYEENFGLDRGPNFFGAGLTAGIGFKKDKIQFDYAYVPYGDLGSSHRVSFGMSF